MPDILASIAESVRPEWSEPTDVSWQQAMKQAIRDPYELCRLLCLPAERAREAVRHAGDFPLFVPRGYAARMRVGDPSDPLLRQVLPLADEREATAGFCRDPVGDADARLRPGLLQKYHGRVLMITTGACAVHCRYCFRRHFPYAELREVPSAWQDNIQQIAADTSLQEVILSGGDPLTIVDYRLAELARALAGIKHLRRLRVHTRLPIVIPERVTGELLDWLTGTRLKPIMVIHANHAAELDQAVAEAVGRLVDARIMVLNQSVLLAGVNDHLAALVELSERLIDLGVVPYYLHQLDRVSGAAHFEVPVSKGKALVHALRAHLPGYAVPRYVQEVAGRAGKLVLA